MKAKIQITTEWYSMIREFLLIFSVQYGIFKCINWEVPSLLLFLTSLFMVLSIRFVKTYSMRKIIFLLTILFLTSNISVNSLLSYKCLFVYKKCTFLELCIF